MVAVNNKVFILDRLDLLDTVSKNGAKIGRPRTASAHPKVCPHCQKKYISDDRRQIYCSVNCWHSTKDFRIAITKERNKRPIKDRFMEKVKLMPSGCWEWQASKKKKGYGRFKVQDFQHAHRFSYHIFKGNIPKGMLVCHKCDNPSCVNPAHLWLGTYSDNINDCYAKGRRGATHQGSGDGA